MLWQQTTKQSPVALRGAFRTALTVGGSQVRGNCPAVTTDRLAMLQAATLAGKLNTFSSANSAEISAQQGSRDSEYPDKPHAAADATAAASPRHLQGCTSMCPRPTWLPMQCNTHALHAFYEHADNSNDIFRVAARVVAMVSSAFYMRIALHAEGSCGEAPQREERDRMLLEAWQPFQAVFKAVWWEQVPMPQDLSDEPAWRSQLKYAP